MPTARERVVKEFERRYVERVLARHGGVVTKAARASGVAVLALSACAAPVGMEDLGCLVLGGVAKGSTLPAVMPIAP